MILFYKILCFFVLDLRLYYVWSRIGRFIYEFGYRDQKIRKYTSVQELEDTMSQFHWRPDQWWQLWDMISRPEAVEARALSGKDVGDCDEFAVYAGTVLPQIIWDNPKEIIGFRDISILTLAWVDNGGLGGHNLCVFKYMEKDSVRSYWAVMSNWYECKIQYSRYESISDLAKSIVFSKSAAGLRWARVSVDIKTMYETGGL